MDNSRRRFLRNASILSGATGLQNVLPLSIQKAFAIEATPGTTFEDAEHVVFLMQENRSFDHIFGTLRGVRGFNDPRVRTQPNGNKVWAQKDKEGKQYPPFHIDINKTHVTWQGGLPHSWTDQTGARNGGKYDKWIPFKGTMTMGYFDRTDLPFYHAFADAFTVCDHYFCSSLTGTTPNRLFFWTGNIRPEPNGASTPAVHNEMAESRDNHYVDWSTFPELLEDNGVSWKVYQNELWTAQLDNKKDYWLGNYGDNALEYVKSHHVKCAPYFRKNGDVSSTPALTPDAVQRKYDALSQREKNIVDRTYVTNMDKDDAYLKLAPYKFTDDEGKEKSVDIPAHDIFHQFRKDVSSGQLPAVSWLVAPQAFSDHTSSPLYGTWYVSEALDILTNNPEVWKKTIFILNYDENDGYFDHLGPFAAPRPGDKNAGAVSTGIDTSSDFYKDGGKNNTPIGLGYRVPMIVASPWSKGGYVNSQIFDHTSTLMFLERWLKTKGKNIQSPNISSWRRSVCGDLSSVFRSMKDQTTALPKFEIREDVVQHIQNAYNKPLQLVPEALSAQEITTMNNAVSLGRMHASRFPKQEVGVRPSCALPYRLQVDCKLEDDVLQLHLANKGIGIAVQAYTPGVYDGELGRCWDFAVNEADAISYPLSLGQFEQNQYNVCIHGPNGFYRHFYGNAFCKGLVVRCDYEAKGRKGVATGNVVLCLQNNTEKHTSFRLVDNAYGSAERVLELQPRTQKEVLVKLKEHHWYDFTISVDGYADLGWQYAGHVENGTASVSDPYMGNVDYGRL